MAEVGEASRQCPPRLFVAGKGPGYEGKNPDQQLAQEWLFGCVFSLAQSAAVEEPGNQSRHKQQNCKMLHMMKGREKSCHRNIIPYP